MKTHLKTILTLILTTTTLSIPNTTHATIIDRTNTRIFANGEQLAATGIIVYPNVYISLANLAPWQFADLGIFDDIHTGQTFSFVDGMFEFEFVMGSDYFFVNGYSEPLSRPLLNIDNMVYVPLQDWAARFGFSVQVNSQTNTAYLDRVTIIGREFLDGFITSEVVITAPDMFEGFFTPYYIVNSRVLLPWYAIAVAGIDKWEQDRLYLIDDFADITMIFTIGSYYFIANDQIIPLDVAAQMFWGIPFLPLRAMLETYNTMGANIAENESIFIDWDPDTRTVYINTERHSVFEPGGYSYDIEIDRLAFNYNTVIVMTLVLFAVGALWV